LIFAVEEFEVYRKDEQVGYYLYNQWINYELNVTIYGILSIMPE
jgi:hypothetical protein